MKGLMKQEDFDYVILSPHLDDGVLSCGGDIFRRTTVGQRVAVVTIMAGDPPAGALSAYAGSLQGRWSLLKEAAAQRRQEDAAAINLLGGEWVHWDVPDCIYRRHPQTNVPFYNSDADIFGDVDPADSYLIGEIARRLKAYPIREGGRLAVPLGIGHHVDHQITRQAAERSGRPLVYYEDYPYAQLPGALEKVISPTSDNWRAQEIPLTAAQLDKKIEAIRRYRSQLSTFFANDADLVHQVVQYSTLVGGERVWFHAKYP